MTTARAILLTLRPRQWVKNSFVVAPLVFSKHLFDVDYALRTAIATAAFCALSGAVYAYNDLRDVEADRAHPIKRHRPIAAGDLGERTALVAALALAMGALTACAALSPELAGAAGAYLALNLGYSLGLKHIAFLDVALIASGFLLRVVAGAFAIAVEASPWLLACTGLLSAMLGFGKRAHELVQASSSERVATATRAALAGYSLRVLRAAMYVLAVATVVAYGFYTQDERTYRVFGTRELIYTVPFCIVGIGRFLYLATWKPRAHSPTDAMLRDAPFMLNIALWGATVLAIVYEPL